VNYRLKKGMWLDPAKSRARGEIGENLIWRGWLIPELGFREVPAASLRDGSWEELIVLRG